MVAQECLDKATKAVHVLCRLRYEAGTFVAHHAGWGSGKERYDRIADELEDPAVSAAPVPPA